VRECPNERSGVDAGTALCLDFPASAARRHSPRVFRPSTMRSFIFIVMFACTTSLFDSHSSFAASPPLKSSGRQAEPYVYVSGGVHRPGRYDWTKGMTLADAIDAAGGFTYPPTRRVRIIPFDAREEFYTRGSTNALPRLEAGDRISVPKRLL
jgi:hypothetical protein